MVSISVFDMMPEAVEEIGQTEAGLWFYAGVLFFAAVVHFIPEPSPSFLAVEGDPAFSEDVPSKAPPVSDGTPSRRSARR